MRAPIDPSAMPASERADERPVRPTRSVQLRQMLESERLEFLLEAHNGLSARIVRESGFRGIWASGLSISAQFGVRDNNEASWTQVVDMLEFMADASDLPILLDGDTGYGNFNNMRRLVRKLEQRGIAPPLDGPRFASLLTRTGIPKDLPRPSITPLEVKRRLMRHFGAPTGVA
jgi:Phosphoenolpyruvate phosphomutase